MKKNSWLFQWGILNIVGGGFLFHGGKADALSGVFIGAVLSVAVMLLRRKCSQKSGRLRFLLGIGLSCFGLLMAVHVMSCVTVWYSDMIEQKWLAILLIAVVLSIGAVGGKKARNMQLLVWGKIMLIAVVATLLFQLPGKEFAFSLHDDALNVGNALQYGVLLFLVNLPFYRLAEDNSDEKNHSMYGVLRILFLWGGYFLVVLCLIGLWEIEILRLAPFPYLLLGQTATTYGGANVRLETVNFLLTMVSLYFAAGVCMDDIRRKIWICRNTGESDVTVKEREVSFATVKKKEREYMIVKKDRAENMTFILKNKRGGTWRLLCSLCVIGICVLLSGENGRGIKLSDKTLVFVGDAKQLEAKTPQAEYSCMELLVVNGTESIEDIRRILQQPNVSYEIPVAYAKKDLVEDMEDVMAEMSAAEAMKYVEEFAKGGTGTGFDEYVTIREYLNALIRGEGVVLPVVGMKQGEIIVYGSAYIKDDNRID